MYYKGGNLLHTIRQLVNDDEKFRGILRGLQRTFGRQTVTGQQVEDYIARQSGLKLDKVFAQYLTTTKIPVLEFTTSRNTVRYRWTGVVPGFDMPVRVTLADSGFALIRPTEQWQSSPLRMKNPSQFSVDENFYVLARRSGQALEAAKPADAPRHTVPRPAKP